jgi:hypothetical protein
MRSAFLFDAEHYCADAAPSARVRASRKPHESRSIDATGQRLLRFRAVAYVEAPEHRGAPLGRLLVVDVVLDRHESAAPAV